jgi:type II secretory pathway component PulJ
MTDPSHFTAIEVLVAWVLVALVIVAGHVFDAVLRRCRRQGRCHPDSS